MDNFELSRVSLSKFIVWRVALLSLIGMVGFLSAVILALLLILHQITDSLAKTPGGFAGLFDLFWAESQRQRLSPLIWIGFAALVMMVGVGFLIYDTLRFTRRRIALPLSALHHAVEQMSAGQLDDPRLIHADDELGQLSKAFLEMAGKIRSQTEALRDSEARFRLLAENSTDMISRHTPDGAYLYVSPVCQVLLGYSPEELIGHSAFDFIAPADHSLVERSRVTILDDQNISTTVYRIQRKDGRLIWLETTSRAICDPQTGQVVEIHAATRDFTARKQAEEALLRERNFSDTILNSLPGIFFVHDWQGMIRWNRNLELVSGYSAEELLKLAPLQIIAESDRDLAHQKMQAAFAGGEFETDVNLLTKGGSVIPYHLKGSQLWIGDQTYLANIGLDISERKRAEAALLKSEALYRQAIEVAGAVPYLQSYIGVGTLIHYDFIGEGIRDITGYGPEEFTAELWDEITLERELLEDLAGQNWLDAIDQVRLRGRAIWKCNHRIRARDGKIHWVFEAAVELRNEKGVSYGSIGLFQDITARKLADDALRESEVRYRLIAENTADVIWVLDVETQRFKYISPSVQKLRGYTIEEVMAQPVSESLTFESAQKVAEILAVRIPRFLAGEALPLFFVDEVDQPCKDGSIVHTEVTTTYLVNEQGKLEIIGVSRDITARKHAEEQLQILKSSIDMAPDGAYWMDRQGRFIYVNDAGCKVLGYTREELLQMNVSEVNPQATPERWAQIWELLKEGKTFVAKSTHRRKDGSEFPVELTSTYGKFGDQEYCNGFARDITERLRAENQIRRMNDELERRVSERTVQLEALNKELEAFSYSVSHDLRAPLRAINGYARMLEVEYADSLPPKAAHLLDSLRSSAGQMGALINELLEFSRLGRQALDKRQLQPASLIQQALLVLSSEQEGRQIEWIISDLPACSGDHILLLQVWVNLLSNALKYTRRRAVARIEVSCQVGEKGEYIYLIKDNGVGFDMRYASKLFGVFQRLHNADQFEGTGVGLALVQRIIQRHGGRIWAEAQPDVGATFYFTLP